MNPSSFEEMFVKHHNCCYVLLSALVISWLVKVGMKQSKIKDKKNSVIMVSEEFEIKNGLLGIYRDVYFELVNKINGDKKIRNMIGVSQECYEWSKHDYFTWARGSVFPCIQKFFKGDDVDISRLVVSISKWSGKRNWVYAFVDKIIDQGIWRIEGKYLKKRGFNPFLSLGIVEIVKKKIKAIDNWDFTPCFSELVNDGDFSPVTFSYENILWDVVDVIALEVSIPTHTLHFFVNGILQPVAYCNIPAAIKFFIRLKRIGDKFEFLTLKRLSKTSVHSSTPVGFITYIPSTAIPTTLVEWKYLNHR